MRKWILKVKREIIIAAIIAFITALIGFAFNYLWDKYKEADQKVKTYETVEKQWRDDSNNLHTLVVTREISMRELRRSKDSQIVELRERMALMDMRKRAINTATMATMKSHREADMVQSQEVYPIYKEVNDTVLVKAYSYTDQNYDIKCYELDTENVKCMLGYKADLYIFDYDKKNGKWPFRWLKPKTRMADVSSNDSNAVFTVKQISRRK